MNEEVVVGCWLIVGWKACQLFQAGPLSIRRVWLSINTSRDAAPVSRSSVRASDLRLADLSVIDDVGTCSHTTCLTLSHNRSNSSRELTYLL